MQKVLNTTFEADVLSDPNVSLVGSYLYDALNPLSGDRSLRMSTDPSEEPFYFWFWRYNLPLMAGIVRLEATAAMNNNMRSFGVGWRIIKNNMLAIMFVRINYATNCIELVQNTEPHIWQTISSPVPMSLRSNNPLRPFRFSLDVDVDTLRYKRVEVHDFLCRTLPNSFAYDLDIPNTPTAFPSIDSMTVKINPQGENGLIGTTWMDEVTVWN
jgi:hypothetical protein